MSEAKRMAENQSEQSVFHAFEQYHAQLKNKVSVYKGRYEFNKIKCVGEDIICPSCGKTHIKKSYQSQFCSNKGKANCKDKYNNIIDDERRNRAHHVNGNKGAIYFESTDDIELWEDDFYRGYEI